jgi:hypothetical protein
MVRNIYQVSLRSYLALLERPMQKVARRNAKAQVDMDLSTVAFLRDDETGLINIEVTVKDQNGKVLYCGVE